MYAKALKPMEYQQSYAKHFWQEMICAKAFVYKKCNEMYAKALKPMENMPWHKPGIHLVHPTENTRKQEMQRNVCQGIKLKPLE